jgi:serine/threonine kinase 38
VGWQKIMKALAQAPLPESEKKHVAERALTREASNTRLMRVKQRLEDYELLEMIGKGAFGEVRLARCKATGEIVAIKRMAKSKLAGKKQVASVFLER